MVIVTRNGNHFFLHNKLRNISEAYNVPLRDEMSAFFTLSGIRFISLSSSFAKFLLKNLFQDHPPGICGTSGTKGRCFLKFVPQMPLVPPLLKDFEYGESKIKEGFTDYFDSR